MQGDKLAFRQLTGNKELINVGLKLNKSKTKQICTFIIYTMYKLNQLHLGDISKVS